MKASTVVKGIGLLALVLSFSVLPPVQECAASLNTASIEEWLSKAGEFAPILFVVLMAMAVVVSPIPSLPLDIAAGAYFGPLLGGFYAVIGGLLGAVASFTIARFFGRGLLERFLGGHVNFCTECSDKLLGRVVFFSRLLPFISFDVVSYGAGLTKMSLGRFALATAVGMVPATFVYTYFGSVVNVSPGVAIPAGIVLVVLFFLIPPWIEKHDLLGLKRH